MWSHSCLKEKEVFDAVPGRNVIPFRNRLGVHTKLDYIWWSTTFWPMGYLAKTSGNTIIQIIKNIWMIIFAQIVRRFMHAAPDHQFSHAQSGACPWSRRYEGLTHRHIPYPSFHTRSSWEVKCFHVKIWSTAWYDFMVRAW